MNGIAAKPGYVPCQYLAANSQGCSIHQVRPKICRDFQCGWLMGLVADEECRPDKLGLLVMNQHNDLGERNLKFVECRENAFLEHGFNLADNLLQRVPDAKYIVVTFFLGRFHMHYSPQWDYVLMGQKAHWRRVRGTPQEAIRMASLCVGGSIHIGAASFSEVSYVVS